MKTFFEYQALLDEFSYATQDGSMLTFEDIKAILKHWDSDRSGTMIELVPQENYDGLKRKYVVLKSDTGAVVENCFVLRPEKDCAAIEALLAYANSTGNKVLAKDIRAWIDDLSGGC